MRSPSTPLCGRGKKELRQGRQQQELGQGMGHKIWDGLPNSSSDTPLGGEHGSLLSPPTLKLFSATS